MQWWTSSWSSTSLCSCDHVISLFYDFLRYDFSNMHESWAIILECGIDLQKYPIKPNIHITFLMVFGLFLILPWTADISSESAMYPSGEIDLPRYDTFFLKIWNLLDFISILSRLPMLFKTLENLTKVNDMAYKRGWDTSRLSKWGVAKPSLNPSRSNTILLCILLASVLLIEGIFLSSYFRASKSFVFIFHFWLDAGWYIFYTAYDSILSLKDFMVWLTHDRNFEVVLYAKFHSKLMKLN